MAWVGAPPSLPKPGLFLLADGSSGLCPLAARQSTLSTLLGARCARLGHLPECPVSMRAPRGGLSVRRPAAGSPSAGSIANRAGSARPAESVESFPRL